ncbi:MAG: hypothetical protein RQ743_12335 [Bacteroidales bacterium]|nr:hypothetical protein [Bacteroidales bacterium]
MKTRKFTHILLAFLLIIVSVSCDELGSEEDLGVIYVTEHITSPTTWLEGKIYLVDINGDFTIEALLTIEPNVIVKFLRENQRIIVRDAGVIQANGTYDKPIIFTSPLDDVHGGDNLGDGPTIPAPGDWGKFYFDEVSGSAFSYCHFYYGGGAVLPTIEVIRSSVDVDLCVFAHNLGGEHTEYIGVVQLDLANPDCMITNNVFFDNVLPMTINANLSIDDSNVFHNPEDPETINVMNGIFTNSYTIDDNVSWHETEVPFVIANKSGLRLESSGSLTLPDNAVVKIVVGTCIDLIQNPDGIINRDGPGVYFTSLRDDTLLGDTDGMGSALVPQDGDWEGIRIALNPLTYAAWPNILYDEIHE